MSDPDRRAHLLPEVNAAEAASTVAAFRQCARGVVYEARLYARPWGFRLEDIAYPRLFLWHGERDSLVPVALGPLLPAPARLAPGHLLCGGRAFSVLVTHLGERLTALLAER